MMYDAASRQQLQEKIAYEGWFIGNCQEWIRREAGVVAPFVFIIKDAPPHEGRMSLGDSFGAGAAASGVNDVTPLLFVSAFKILDMIIEWCIVENKHYFPKLFPSFKDKILCLRGGVIQVWPDFLGADADLRHVVSAVYEQLKPKRNSIVHGKWGSNNGGDLHFDYQYDDDLAPAKPFPRIHDLQIVVRAEVLAFSEFAATIQAMLLAPLSQTPERIGTLRLLANSFSPLHGQPALAAQPMNQCRMIRQTALNEVDLDQIRLEMPWKVGTYRFDLEVERGPEKWVVPWDKLTGLVGTLKLDQALDAWRV
jgi:hypothetical protein